MEKHLEFTYHHVKIAPSLQSPVHSQPTWEISFVLKGSGYRVIGDRCELFREGDLVVIPPGISHCWYFDDVHTDEDGNIENITVVFESAVIRQLSMSLSSVKPLLDKLLSLQTSLTFTEQVR